MSFTWWQSQDMATFRGYRIVAEYEVHVTYDANGRCTQAYTGRSRMRFAS